jgi:hypothetical protein
MGALDFLFQGSTPTQGTNYRQSQSNVPTWLQDYTQWILAQSSALASQPYQTYGGPQVAGFTPQQTQAQNTVQGLQGQYQPTLTQAQQLATSAANPSAITSAQSYLPQAQQGIQSALGTASQGYQGAQAYLPQAQQGIQSALSTANQGYGGALSYLPQAQQYLQQGLAPTAAQMNPYAQNVIGQAETQAKQFWQNQLQPSIQQQYAAAGQSGSSADLRAQEEQANQLAESIQATGNAALGQAYQQAQQAGLAGAQQEAGLGSLAAGIAGQQGQLGLAGAQQTAGLGSTAAGITGQQGSLGLQGASALGSLGQIGGGLGYEQGALGLQGANTLGGLASTGQTLGLQGAGALETTGAEQQALNQQNLNVARQDFLNQQQYPYQQEAWLSQMLAGTATPTTVPGNTQSSQTSYAPSTGASPLSQALGLYAGLNSGPVGSALGGAARGGSMRRRLVRRGSALESLQGAV